MSPERSTPVNPGEDAPLATKPISGGAYRPPSPFSPFGDGNIHSHTQGQYWTTSPLNEPPPTTHSTDSPLHFSPVSDQAPLGDTTKQPEPAPSTSTRNFLDPDTLSSGSLREQLLLVNQKINDVQRTLKTKDEHAEGPLHGSSFIHEIQDAHIPSHFRLPMLEAYDGSSDPTKHVIAFYAQMTLWLPPSSIHSFNQLAREFEGNFLSSARPKSTVTSLLGMRQKEEEHLGQYLAHFTDGVRAIPDAHPSLIIQAFMIGIRPSYLFWSLVERPPITVPEILQRANQYITVETMVAEKHEDHKHPQGEPSRGPPFGLSRRRVERDEQAMPRPPNVLLNSTQMEIFLQIREKGLLKTPNLLRSRAED
ncbi:hypothetical protein B296_00009514 [Ensete ventricosum]|uniref:Retrotransposon gag domain-containing protein n=1 Tax=Ensete ventricosum TaxID=4639 RepID=A0A426ZRP6_ENSVE|nr:hypothetical protein B296_00009514 [Ensete ventricosum]